MAAQLEIVLYKGTPPNRKNGVHLLCSGIKSFRDKITDPSYYADGLTQFDAFVGDNFRYNLGFLIVAATEFTEKDLNEITYAVEYLHDPNVIGEAGYRNMRCFFVESGYFQSSNAYFKIELDKWGTYNRFATFSRCHITRCNRDIGNGVYDPIKTTKGRTTYALLQPYDIPLNKVAVVFLIQHNVSQSLFGDNQISKTSLLYMTFQTIYDTLHAFVDGSYNGSVYDNLEAIPKVIDLIGGIYATSGVVATPSGVHIGVGADVAAEVLKAWFVPADTIMQGRLGIHELKSKSLITEGHTIVFTDVMEVSPANYEEALNYKNKLQNPLTQWPQYMPQCHVEVGAKFRGLAINRFTQETTAYFHYVYTNAGVSVYVEEGLQQEDITESFEVTLTLNNATETALVQTSKIFAKLTSSAAAMAKGYAKSGVMGAAMAAGTSGLSVAAASKDASPLQALGNGDGAYTFGPSSAQEVSYPYVVMVTRSNDNEDEHVRFYGAKFDMFDDDLVTIQAQNLLGNYSGASPDGTYLQIDDMLIKGVNAETEQYIRDEFARGIWYKVL